MPTLIIFASDAEYGCTKDRDTFIVGSMHFHIKRMNEFILIYSESMYDLDTGKAALASNKEMAEHWPSIIIFTTISQIPGSERHRNHNHLLTLL
jgi:hypothetical protein